MSNIFKGRTDGKVFKGKYFEDVDVNVYKLAPKLIKDADNAEGALVLTPVVVDSFKMQKCINERVKGNTLLDIIKKVETTGDISLLNQRQPVYGDGYMYPDNLADALQKGVDIDNSFSRLNDDQRKEISKILGLNEKDLGIYIKTLADKAREKVKIENEKKIEKKEEVSE